MDRAEHRAVAKAAAEAAIAADNAGDTQTWQRERRAAIAHSHAARDAADRPDQKGR